MLNTLKPLTHVGPAVGGEEHLLVHAEPDVDVPLAPPAPHQLSGVDLHNYRHESMR